MSSNDKPKHEKGSAMPEIKLSREDVIPAGTYNFYIFVTSSPVGSSYRGEYDLRQDTAAGNVAVLIAEFCLGHHPDSIAWLFLDQGHEDEPNFMFLELGRRRTEVPR